MELNRREQYRAEKVRGFTRWNWGWGVRRLADRMTGIRRYLPPEGHTTADIMEIERDLFWLSEKCADATPPGWMSWPAWASWRIDGLLASVDRWRERALAAETGLRHARVLAGQGADALLAAAARIEALELELQDQRS